MPRKNKQLESVNEIDVKAVNAKAVKEVPVVEEVTEEILKDVTPEATDEEVNAPQAFYNRELVVNVENRVMNGRMYKDVRTVNATYLLSPEEYETEVKIK